MRGVNRGLDIILDEEEDNLDADLPHDTNLKPHEREDSPEFTIRNNVSLRQDGSICFFGADDEPNKNKDLLLT